jgi:hypothetical protein
MAAIQAVCEDALEGEGVSADNLLLWMSARKEGSWHQFRGAVEELHIAIGEEEDEEGAGAGEHAGRLQRRKGVGPQASGR